MRDLIKEIERAIKLRRKWGQAEQNSLISLFMNDDEDNNIICDFDSGEEVCGFFRDSQLYSTSVTYSEL